MKRVALFFSMLLMVLLIVACGSNEDSSGKDNNNESNGSNNENNGSEEQTIVTEVPSDITFGAATVGGFWYTLSGAMSDKMGDVFPDSTVTIVEGGSTANILGLGNGTFDVGFTNGEAISEANNGTGEFDEVIDNFSTIATLYPNPVQVVVRADSDIKTIEDLKGKKVSPGIKGYSGEIAFMKILDILDMSYDDLADIEYTGTEDAANLLRDKHIDAWIGNLVAPSATWQELDTTVGIRLLSLGDDVIDSLYSDNEGYVPYTLEAGTYPNQDEDVETVAPFSVLLVNNDTMPEDAVYELTKMVIEHTDTWKSISTTLDDFDAEYSIENNVGVMHPGAERYYKEVGALE